MNSILNYTIEKEIGRGGMATVYLAIQDKLKRKVALKVMTPEMAKDENFRRSFMSEATIIASLDHPNIVRIYDVEVIDDLTLYMAMEYLSGGTLKEKLLKGKMLLPECLKVIEQISEGLHHAHQKGYIHRDIKPGNILFRNDGTTVLTDFGIAKLQDTSGELTRMGFTMGTLQYMSPEQVITTDLDQRSDIYSLGLVFYEMLTGLKAFRAESTVQAIHQHTTVPPPKLEGDYIYLQTVIDKVLAKKPEDRYQKVMDFLDALKGASEADKTVIHKLKSNHNDKTLYIPGTDSHIPLRPEKPKRKNRSMPIIMVGSLLVGGGAFTAYKLIDPENKYIPAPIENSKRGISGRDKTKYDEKLVLDESRFEAPIQTKEENIKIKQKRIEYFHEPQYNFVKLENELEALKKSTVDLLAFSPDNQKAQETLKNILKKYNILAENSIKSMNLKKASNIINDGLSVSTTEISLIKLKRKVEKKETPSATQKSKINKLLITAELHLKNGSYVLPLGSNALESYQEILLIEPENTEATRKIKKIKVVFETQINKNIDKNTFFANSLVNQARSLFPYDEKFIRLQQRIKSMNNY